MPKSEQAANSLMGNAVAAHVVAHVAQRLALGRPVTAGDRQPVTGSGAVILI